MVWNLGVAASAALIRLACPHCGTVQARARKPKGERYRCRKCHHLFTRDEGEAAAKRKRR
jgi:transposase-like protein